MPPKGFKCKRCGNCCIKLIDSFQGTAEKSDIKNWEKSCRSDILECVGPIRIGENSFVYDIWISPTTGEDVLRCPWLKKHPGKQTYYCRIQDLKPKVAPLMNLCGVSG